MERLKNQEELLVTVDVPVKPDPLRGLMRVFASVKLGRAMSHCKPETVIDEDNFGATVHINNGIKKVQVWQYETDGLTEVTVTQDLSEHFIHASIQYKSESSLTQDDFKRECHIASGYSYTTDRDVVHDVHEALKMVG